jgi:chemotaxis protein CheD
VIASVQPVLPRVHLNPGELLITGEPQVVVTVLGSCVAVTMFAPRHGLAAICHAMLAAPPPCAGVGDRGSFRYVSHALPAMFEAYRHAGIGVGEVEVKLFGGANAIRSSGVCVGAANLATARRLLDEARAIVRAENTGGPAGRKLIFHTGTGDVLHKHLGRHCS